MMRYTHRQQGYTLIELLLYIAMVGILLAALTAFFGVTTDARIKNQSMMEVNEQGAYALDIMTQTVRGATSIPSPLVGVSGSQLTTVMPTAALSPTIFDVSEGALRIKEGTGSPIALTSSKVQVTSLTISNLTRSGTAGIVQISLTLSRVNPTGANQYAVTETFTTSVGVRP